jgi:hypothetical protein
MTKKRALVLEREFDKIRAAKRRAVRCIVKLSQFLDARRTQSIRKLLYSSASPARTGERTLSAMRLLRRILILFVGVLAVACETSNTPKGDPIAPGTTTRTTTSGVPTSPASTSPPASQETEGTKTIFVRDALADCQGEGPRKCLQIRESENDDWTLLYTGIEGFQYEESYAYVLKVKADGSRGDKTGAADAPSKKLRLVEVLSKQKSGTQRK